jgi:hypothetical protein
MPPENSCRVHRNQRPDDLNHGNLQMSGWFCPGFCSQKFVTPTEVNDFWRRADPDFVRVKTTVKARKNRLDFSASPD